ncbi:MAG: DUF2341 domain-containing protein, partial [Elusimicrobia bacterium]|nr:DUF2341 domain-containing protein [Elusimicrobiota bacterium]
MRSTPVRILACAALVAAAQARVWAAGEWAETSDSHFDLGTFNGAYRSGTGAAAEVRLEYSGRAAGLGGAAGPGWYDAAWQYRRTLTINSSNASALTDYQVLLTLDTASLVAAGRLKADLSDVRFTGDDGVTPRSYWIESATKVWVKVPSIPASGSVTLYLYYGNSAAASASSVTDTFVFGDDFTGADGASPDSARWDGIETGTVQSGSSREIQGGALRLTYGSAAGANVYGLRSTASPSFGSGLLRYRVLMKAASLGTGTTSTIALCPDAASASQTQANSLRFQLAHTPTPRYRLDERRSSISFPDVANTDIAAGYHDVEFRVGSSTLTVLVDGAQIFSNSNYSFLGSPYIYLEAGRSNGTPYLGSFPLEHEFDTLLVSRFSAPEPSQGATGGEEGRYDPLGTFTSQTLDSGAAGTQAQAIAWAWTVPANSSITVRLRGHDTDVGLGTFQDVSSGTLSTVFGRYLQYQAVLNTQNLNQTPALSSVTVTYLSAPKKPGSFAGVALSTTQLRWTWTDPSSVSFQEDGLRIYTSSSGLKRELAADAVAWDELGLSPNTTATALVEAFNAVGSSRTALLTVRTLAPVPNVTADRATGTWFNAGGFVFTNGVGFGDGKIDKYRYVWDTSPSHSWTDSEPDLWTSGALTRTPGGSGSFYLHVRSYNGDNVASGSADYGPFNLDVDYPAISGFSPSSSPWTSSDVTVNVSLTDIGGAGLASVRHAWTDSHIAPFSGHSAWQGPDVSVSGNAVTLQRVQFAQSGGLGWFLHIELTDKAGNQAVATSGVAPNAFYIDKTPPSGSVQVNGFDAFTRSTGSVLTLTYSDSPSGIAYVKYRNSPSGAFGGPEAPVGSKSWGLATGQEGARTVEYLLVDGAGNQTTVSDSITLNRNTLLTLADVSVPASGETAGQAKTFTAVATLVWSPTGNPVNGQTVTIGFRGDNQSRPTNASGQASYTFAVPTSTGVYLGNDFFANYEDAPGEYNGSDTGALNPKVTVTQRNTLLVAFNTTADTGGEAALQASLFDTESLENLADKTVSFVFRGSTRTAVTDSLGIARTTFTAPSSSGTYPYSASFVGGLTYRSSANNGNVLAKLRDTLLVADPISTYKNEVFTARARLLEKFTAVPLTFRPLSFMFGGSTKTTATDGDGVATSTFSAVSVGSFTYVVAFSTTPDVGLSYSSAGANVSIPLRPVVLSAVAVSTTVSTAFQASARLRDGLDNSVINDRIVTFQYNGATQTGTTQGGLGEATTTYTSQAAPGSYSLAASVAASADHQALSTSAAVAVFLRPTNVAMPDRTANAQSVFTASVTLRDVVWNQTLGPGFPVSLVFLGTTTVVGTDASGVAAATFTAPGGTGLYPFAFSYAGASPYAAASGSATITVNTKLSILSADGASARWGTVFTATATLRELTTGLPINARVVRFVLGTETRNEATENGVATAEFTAPGSTGSFRIDAFFDDGDPVYVQAAASATLASVARPSRLTPLDVSVTLNETFTSSATLVDDVSGLALGSRLVTLSFGEDPHGVYAADGSGLATYNFVATGVPRVTTFTAAYAGEPLYAGDSELAVVNIGIRPPTLSLPDVTATATEVFFATATLTDGGPLAGRTIDFTLQGVTRSSVTNASGVAVATFTAPSGVADYALSALFPGGVDYGPVGKNATLTVRKHPTELKAVDLQAAVNSTFTAQATLKDLDSNALLAGRWVSFVFLGSTKTVLTDASGLATTTYVTSSSTEIVSYSASFDGEPTRLGSSDVGQVLAGLRYTAVVPFDAMGFAKGSFTATAKLIDLVTSDPLPGHTVVFTFNGSTQAVSPTDAEGRVTFGFDLPTAAGSLQLRADFAGDSIYVLSTGTSTITALKRPTVVNFGPGWSNGSCYTLSTAGLTIDVLDALTATPIEGMVADFQWGAETDTVATGANGSATASFVCGAAPATFSSTATLRDHPTYLTSGRTTASSIVARPTEMLAFSEGSYTLDTYAAEARLSQTIGGSTPLEGKHIRFTNWDGAVKVGTTAPDGWAYVVFPTSSNAGTYRYDAVFDDDVSYIQSSSAAYIGVSPRPTTLSAYASWTPALDAIGFRADLFDSLRGTPIRYKEIDFYFQGSTRTSAGTNALGQAFSSTDSTAPAGPFLAIATAAYYYYEGSFSGDSTYAPSTSTNYVDVYLRYTGITGAPVDATINSDFIASLSLTDTYTAQPIQNKIATFTYDNGAGLVTSTAVTNNLGVATATFRAGAATGNGTYSVGWDGDISYAGATGVGSVRTLVRPASLIVYDADVAAGRDFEGKAELRDSFDNSLLSAVTISMTYPCDPDAAPLCATEVPQHTTGIATRTFTAPASTGTIQYYAYYSGNETYGQVWGTGTVHMNPRPTLLIAGSLLIRASDQFYATAILRDNDTDLGVGGEPIELEFEGQTISTRTQTSPSWLVGVTSAPFQAPFSTGTLQFYARFPGQALYEARVATGSISLRPRLSAFSLPSFEPHAGQTFSLQVTLSDAANGTRLGPGMPVSLVFNGTTTVVNTNAAGQAAADFLAPASTGTRSYSALFGGSTFYETVSGAGEVNTLRRETTLLVDDQEVKIGDALTSRARLYDGGVPIANEWISFVFAGSTQHKKTDDLGVATVTYSGQAPLGAAGTPVYTASFTATALYDAALSTATVNVVRRLSALSLPTFTPEAGKAFSIQVVLTDAANGTALGPGQEVTLVYNGTTTVVDTNGLGEATTDFVAPNSTGTLSYTATYDGDSTYEPISRSANVNAFTRSTTLLVDDVTVRIDNGFQARARLYDAGVPIPDASVTFVFDGTTQHKRTDGLGVATVTFSGQPVLGAVNSAIYTASFTANALYSANWSTATVSVIRRVSALDVPTHYPDTGRQFAIGVTLTDNDTGAPINPADVTLVFNGTTTLRPTNAQGQASYDNFIAPGLGVLSYSADFAGNARHEPVGRNGSVDVRSRATTLLVDDRSVLIDDAMNARARLYDSGSPIAGATITFVFAGSTQQVLTDQSGVASINFSGQTVLTAQGSSIYTASYTASGQYGSAMSTAGVSISRRPTTLDGPDPSVLLLNAFVTTTTLRDPNAGNVAVPGIRPIKFTFNGSTRAATTNFGAGVGVATASFGAPATANTYDVLADFLGDSKYLPASSTKTLTATKRPISLGTDSVSPYVNDPFTGVAHLYDSASGLGLPYKSVTFTFTHSGMTDTRVSTTKTDDPGNSRDHIAKTTATFRAPGVPADLSYSWLFAGDNDYQSGSHSAAVTVRKRPSIFLYSSVNQQANRSDYTISVTLKDSITQNPLANRQVWFRQGSQSEWDETDGDGVAVFDDYATPSTAQTTQYTITFNEDATYEFTSGTGTLTVSKRTTSWAAQSKEVDSGEVFFASATLRDNYTGAPRAAVPVTVQFQGLTTTTNTTSAGVAIATFTAPSDTGVYPATFTYAGDSTYESAVAYGDMTVATYLTQLAVTTGTFTVDQAFVSFATLSYLTGGTGPIANKLVYFTLRGPGGFENNAAPVATSGGGGGLAAGVASHAWSGQLPRSTGTYTVTASFNGDAPASLAASSTTVNAAVKGYQTSIGLGANPSTHTLSVFYATGTFGVAGGAETAEGRTISFAFESFDSENAPTDAAGKAVATLSGPSSGTWKYTALFAGTTRLEPVSVEGSVTLSPRQLNLVVTDLPAPTSVYANTLHTATATATDFAGAVGNLPIAFTYQGASLGTKVTNGVGVATVSYNVGTSSGDHKIYAQFVPSASYTGLTDHSTTTVRQRETALTAHWASAVVSAETTEQFTASATVRDLSQPGSPGVGGLTLSFGFEGQTRNVATNGSGVATVADFDSPNSTGTHSFSVTFSSTPVYRAPNDVASSSVQVGPRATQLVVDALSVPVSSTVYLGAQLTSLGSSMQGHSIYFNFRGTDGTPADGATASNGRASAARPSGASYGTFRATVTFPGDALHQAATGYNDITVTKRGTSMLVPNAPDIYVDEAFTATATVKDLVDDNNPITSGVNVDFTYRGSQLGDTTDTSSPYQAYRTFTTQSTSSGTWTFTAAFAEDAAYLGSSGTGQVTVLKRPTTLNAANVAGAVKANETFWVTAVLADSRLGGQPIAGETVRFTYNGVTKTDQTDGSGEATIDFTANRSTGPLYFNAQFLATPKYDAKDDNGVEGSNNTVTIETRPSFLSVAPVTVNANESFTAAATLLDAHNPATDPGRAQKRIAFTYKGVTSYHMTNASGLAQWTTAQAGVDGLADPFELSASFAGDGAFEAKTGSAAVTVNQRTTAMTADPATTWVDEYFTATAYLKDVGAGNAGIAGERVDFVFRELPQFDASTDGSLGTATTAYWSGLSSGTHRFSASFTQTSTYLASSTNSIAVFVQQRPTTVGIEPVTVTAGVPFLAAATLTDDRKSNAPIQGETVYFVYGSSTNSGVTGADGRTTVQFVSVPGAAQYSATHAGVVVYGFSSATGTVTVSPRVTVVTAQSTSAWVATSFSPE